MIEGVIPAPVLQMFKAASNCVRFHRGNPKTGTLNLICTVLLRPSMLSLLSIPRVWDTSQQAIFNRRAAAQEGENTEVGTRFLCLLRKFFLNPYYNGKPRFAKLTQKKNAAISKRLQRFLKPI